MGRAGQENRKQRAAATDEGDREACAVGDFKAMKYTKSELEEIALKAIDKFNILFLDEIAAHLPVSRATFYNKKLHEAESIREAIEDKRILTRQAMKKKWYDSDHPTLQIALYKLICPPEELERIAGGRQKHDVSFPNGLPAEVVKIVIPENGRDAKE